jgi:hypothetical protein
VFEGVYCQVFKKNQVTGVREIHILDIVSRCFARFRENIARTIISTDRREMLTKGNDKFNIIKTDLRNSIRDCPCGLAVRIYHFSEDMATWAQRFVIDSFSQLLKPHSREFSKINDWSQFILSKFKNKVIELPSNFLKELYGNKFDFHESLEHAVNLKGKLLSEELTGIIKNDVGMWMGILHYTSSSYHLCLVSLIENIFWKKLSRMEASGVFKSDLSYRVRHNSYVSSDDRYRSLMVFSNDEVESRAVFDAYKCTGEMVSKLFNVKLSEKSAIGNIIGEFNSVFFTYESYLSATIKFAIQACGLFTTESPEQHVRESFSSVRAAFENGLSCTSCYIAHLLNAKKHYWIFQTGNGQQNNLLGDMQRYAPVEVGVYPFF